MMRLSVVIPCLNEGRMLESGLLLAEIREALGTVHLEDAQYEIVFIDDGSTDDTLDILRSISREDPSVRFISFSRNFGKEAAIFAGLTAAQGEYVAIMDADLQDPPPNAS